MNDSPLERLAAEDGAARKRKGTLHTPAEILKQPGMWRRTAERLAGLAEPAESVRRSHDEYLVLAGAGSSLNAATLVAELVRGAMGPRVSSISGTDILLAPEEYVPKGRGRLISLSRSGDSPEVVEAARRTGAVLPSAAQMAVTCKPDGALARWIGEGADRVLCVLDPETYDRGLATTVSVTTMVLAGLFLADPRPARDFEREVEQAASACERLLARHAATAQEIARRKPDRVVFLGTGAMEAAAREAALKAVELTDGRVASMSRNFLEFRHGPIAFLSPGTVLVCLGSAREDVRPYERDFIRQAREARGAGLLVVTSPGGDPASIEGADVAVELPALGGLEALMAVVFGQMLGLFLSLEYGLTPDRPGDRGLVNPVVQGVTIYPHPKT